MSRTPAERVSVSSVKRVSPLSSPLIAGALKSNKAASTTFDSTLFASRPVVSDFSSSSPSMPATSSFTRALTSLSSMPLTSKRSAFALAGSAGSDCSRSSKLLLFFGSRT